MPFAPERPRKKDYKPVPPNNSENNDDRWAPNVNNTEEPLLSNPLPPPENDNNNSNNNVTPTPPLPNETPADLSIGKGKEDRKTSEVGKQLTEAVKREPGRGKSIDGDVKYVQLKALQAAYEDGDKGPKARDFNDVEKLVNEFLDGFDDNGPLKTAFLKNYKTKLDKTHWTLYLKNLFEVIGKLSNKPSILNNTRKKGGRRAQTNSKRTTRKIRR